MGWYITLGILFLLAVLPLGVSVMYDSEGPLVKVIAGPLRLKVYPLPKKKDKKKPEKKTVKKTAEDASLPKPPQPPKAKKEKTKEKKGGSLTDFIPFVKLAFNFLGDFRRIRKVYPAFRHRR